MKNALTFILVLAIIQPLVMYALLHELGWGFYMSAVTATLVAALFAEYARRLSKDSTRL